MCLMASLWCDATKLRPLTHPLNAHGHGTWFGRPNFRAKKQFSCAKHDCSTYTSMTAFEPSSIGWQDNAMFGLISCRHKWHRCQRTKQKSNSTNRDICISVGSTNAIDYPVILKNFIETHRLPLSPVPFVRCRCHRTPAKSIRWGLSVNVSLPRQRRTRKIN